MVKLAGRFVRSVIPGDALKSVERKIENGKSDSVFELLKGRAGSFLESMGRMLVHGRINSQRNP